MTGAIIRNGTTDDIPAVVDMSFKFYAQTPYAAHVPLREDTAAGLALMTMRQDTLLVAEVDGAVVGMLSAFIDRFTFNPDYFIVNELAFWVNEEARGSSIAVKMVRAMRERCREKGVKFFSMAALSSSPEVAERLYKALGLSPIANVYMEVLQ